MAIQTTLVEAVIEGDVFVFVLECGFVLIARKGVVTGSAFVFVAVPVEAQRPYRSPDGRNIE
jgi:hypothetical protein